MKRMVPVVTLRINTTSPMTKKNKMTQSTRRGSGRWLTSLESSIRAKPKIVRISMIKELETYHPLQKKSRDKLPGSMSIIWKSLMLSWNSAKKASKGPASHQELEFSMTMHILP